MPDCLREAGVGGSNPLTPTNSYFAIPVAARTYEESSIVEFVRVICWRTPRRQQASSLGVGLSIRQSRLAQAV